LTCPIQPVTVPLCMSLNNLAPELKVAIILHLRNPTSLARCSREWNNTVNLPSTKSKWLIGRHGRTHALFHAVRMGEPFINLDVVECLFRRTRTLVDTLSKEWCSNLE